ncbi:hypothetical protein GCM10025864_36530 [Luteimicrobium album]|uniref:Secreted protein n=1 Tax=Luteimicrobium album TaxID=1054550 RepID=A0ABQ6I7Z6_9MICO|nr:hypothetical protein [Luteimicrobium album]GMA25894.1 hypothetical protein GCM10025864_36530 [Luteimicrobium album]
MRRLFWIGVGVAVTVVVVRQGRKVVARYAPASLVDQATDRANAVGGRAVTFVRTFGEEFRTARDAREAELEAALLAEGQSAPGDVRRARAEGRRLGDARPAEPGGAVPRDEDDPDVGYAFF